MFLNASKHIVFLDSCLCSHPFVHTSSAHKFHAAMKGYLLLAMLNVLSGLCPLDNVGVQAEPSTLENHIITHSD